MVTTQAPALEQAVASLVYDPLAFVQFNWPWGEPGPLQHATGPVPWQADILERLGQGLRTGETTRIAVASGHGVGKSALCAWLIHFFLATRPHPQIVVTAGTSAQLTTKTWRELAVWHQMARTRDWFDWTATTFRFAHSPETWFASAIPWSKERAQSFAGTHARYVLLIFDEASTIDDSIWEVAEGAMSTPGACWVAFGNPERNTGRFRECFGRFRHRWHTTQIDARTVSLTNHEEIAQQIADYGEDSDFVRVRWLGQFPRQSALQFISEETLAQAQARESVGYQAAPRILGVDVARFGDDQTVLLLRQGTNIELLRSYRGLDTMRTASLVAELSSRDEFDAVFVDEVGIGAGVVDRLTQLGHRVIGVNAGAAASDPRHYFNLRAEMWAKMRAWLEHGGCLPSHQQLYDDLRAPLYGYTGAEALQLERKEDMKKRGIASPDHADALALTFAQPVQPHRDRERQRQRKRVAFNPYTVGAGRG